MVVPCNDDETPTRCLNGMVLQSTARCCTAYLLAPSSHLCSQHSYMAIMTRHTPCFPSCCATGRSSAAVPHTILTATSLRVYSTADCCCWVLQRQAVVVHKHWVQRRYWYAWRAFLQQCWRARCTLNAAHQHRHMQLQSHSFLKWRQETAEQRWLHAAQQSHRLRLLFRR